MRRFEERDQQRVGADRRKPRGFEQHVERKSCRPGRDRSGDQRRQPCILLDDRRGGRRDDARTVPCLRDRTGDEATQVVHEQRRRKIADRARKQTARRRRLLDLERMTEGPQRPRRLTAREMDGGDTVQRFRIVGTQPHRSLEGRRRRIEVPLLLEHHAEIHVRLGIGRLAFDRPGIARRCVGELPGLVQHAPKQEMRVRPPGSEHDRASDQGERELMALRPLRCDAERAQAVDRVVRDGRCGRGCDGWFSRVDDGAIAEMHRHRGRCRWARYGRSRLNPGLGCRHAAGIVSIHATGSVVLRGDLPCAPCAAEVWRAFVESMSPRDHPATFSRRMMSDRPVDVAEGYRAMDG